MLGEGRKVEDLSGRTTTIHNNAFIIRTYLDPSYKLSFVIKQQFYNMIFKVFGQTE